MHGSTAHYFSRLSSSLMSKPNSFCRILKGVFSRHSRYLYDVATGLQQAKTSITCNRTSQDRHEFPAAASARLPKSEPYVETLASRLSSQQPQSMPSLAHPMTMTSVPSTGENTLSRSSTASAATRESFLSSDLLDELLVLAESMDSSPTSEAMRPNVPPTPAVFPSAPAGAGLPQLPTGHALDSMQQRRLSVLTGMDRGLLATLTITSPRGIPSGTGFSMSRLASRSSALLEHHRRLATRCCEKHVAACTTHACKRRITQDITVTARYPSPKQRLQSASKI
jgi:hypothetical protein